MKESDDSQKYKIKEIEEIFSNFFYSTKYKNKITSAADLCNAPEYGLVLDYNDLESYFEDDEHAIILTQLFDSPIKVLIGIEKAIEKQLFPDQCDRIKLNPRLINLPIDRELRVSEIRALHIGTLIRSSGRIKKIRQVVPKMVTGVFRCIRCGAVIKEEQPMSTFDVKEPLECYKDQGGCKRVRTSWELLSEESVFRNLQIAYLEETYDPSHPHQPQTKRVFLWDDLAGVIPTNNAIINCVVKTFQGVKTSVPEIYLEAVGCEFPEDYYRHVIISDEDKKKILEVMHSDNVYDKVINSIAPTIQGHRNIKLAIALALFRGVDKYIDDTHLRGKSHICIIGDPSTAKSKILQYTEKLAPKAIYSSGEGASGVGLTFALVKDEIDKSWVVEMGVLPLANNGVAIIDELDKMSKEDRERIHTAMESGILPVRKAGIVQTLLADCTIIAGGNPKMGRFDSYTPLIIQIDLPPELLSRFDLIFAIEDRYEDTDRELTKHILTTHRRYDDKNYIITKPPLAPEFFRKMVAYAWDNIKPRLTEGANTVLEEFFLSLRKVDEVNEKAAPVSWRQLEGLIRLSEASARIRGSDRVEKEDTERVIHLVKESLYASCFEGGIYDFDLLTTGYRIGQRERMQLYFDYLKKEDGTTLSEIYDFAQSNGINLDVSKIDIAKLVEEGRIYCIHGLYRLSPI